MKWFASISPAKVLLRRQNKHINGVTSMGSGLALCMNLNFESKALYSWGFVFQAPLWGKHNSVFVSFEFWTKLPAP
jgi:hypothetical protein